MVRMKFILNSLLLLLCISTINAVPLSDELVILHSATTVEMNALASPKQGSLIFNTDDNLVYERNATAWHSTASDGSETKVVAGRCMDITGIGTTSNPYIIKDRDLGETQATAGLTCKEIVNNGCNTRDGIYWINPDGGSTENAFEVYCDISNGGWTKIEYTSDLLDKKYFGSKDAWSWLTTNFSLVLTDAQINSIRAVSTEGKQTYVGKCDGVITYYYNSGRNYNYAFGFRFQTGYETVFGKQDYTGINITVLQDGCKTNRTDSADTIFEIHDIKVPIINVYSNDNGGTTETFGSPLTNNPAWLR